MQKNGGVELLLVPGTRIPLWIRVQDKNVVIEPGALDGKPVKRLRILGGDADLVAGGQAIVIVPGSSGAYTAFGHGPDSRVLEIRDLRGKLLKRNFRCCPKCIANTGEFVEETREKHVVICQDCGESWRIHH